MRYTNLYHGEKNFYHGTNSPCYFPHAAVFTSLFPLFTMGFISGVVKNKFPMGNYQPYLKVIVIAATDFILFA